MQPFDFICVGSAHWDVVGKISSLVRPGFDCPGSVDRIPGGVALNVALAIESFGEPPLLWSVTGDDSDGRELVGALEKRGLRVDGVRAVRGGRTDRCMFILDSEESVTGVSDCGLLEEQSDVLIRELASVVELNAQMETVLIVDGNLPQNALTELASATGFRNMTLRFVVASDGKAVRARAFLERRQTLVYMNKAEAEIVAGRRFPDSAEAAGQLVRDGFERVIVTDRDSGIADCNSFELITLKPEYAGKAVRLLGAGDNLVAAREVAERRGYTRELALDFAVKAAQRFVAGSSSA